MKNVKYIALSNDGSSFYRISGVLPYIKHDKLNLTDISDKNIFSWENYTDTDIVIIQRPCTQAHLGLILQAQMMGCKVIVDLDDLVTHVPEYNPAHGLYKENMKHVLQCIRVANELWVSTEAIRHELVKYNKNIHVIPNAHNNYLFKEENKKEFNAKNKMVFYRGGSTHVRDLRHILGDLVRVMRRKQDWTFMFIGIDTNDEFSEAVYDLKNVFITNPLPVIQYHVHLHAMNPAIMICPLDNIPLNRAKSNISFLEGTYAGAAFIGKKILPEFNKEFIMNIDRLDLFDEYCNPNRLKSYNNQAWAYICEHLLLSKINQLRTERLLIK